MLTLRDLLAAKHLRLRLVCGEDAALERPVRAVYTTDLLDPGRYVSGGELVVSGLVWRTSADTSEIFVSAVAGAGAAALAAGETMFGGIPDDVADACRRLGLPLVSVPEEVSFARITEHVAEAVTAGNRARLTASLSRQQQLLAAMAQGRGLADLVQQVSHGAGLACRVLTATGRAVVPGQRELPVDDLDRVTRAFLTANRLPAVTTERDRPVFSVFSVGPALGPRSTSWFVAVEGVWTDWEQDATDAVGELASIAALDRSRHDEVLRVTRQIAEDAYGLLDRGQSGLAEMTVRLRQAGLDPDRPLAVVVAGLEGRSDLALAVLDDATAQLGPAAVVAAPDGSAVAIVSAAHPEFSTTLRRAFGRLEAWTGRVRLAVGISAASEVSALSGALSEARHAHHLARLRPGKVEIVTGEEVTSYVLLLATVPDDVRRRFAHRVLGPVIAYDAQFEAGLTATLRAFLGCDGSWTRTAAALHLHVNSVRYRIHRIEELTGHDLSRLEDRVDAFLAIHSL